MPMYNKLHLNNILSQRRKLAISERNALSKSRKLFEYLQRVYQISPWVTTSYSVKFQSSEIELMLRKVQGDE